MKHYSHKTALKKNECSGTMANTSLAFHVLETVKLNILFHNLTSRWSDQMTQFWPIRQKLRSVDPSPFFLLLTWPGSRNCSRQLVVLKEGQSELQRQQLAHCRPLSLGQKAASRVLVTQDEQIPICFNFQNQMTYTLQPNTLLNRYKNATHYTSLLEPQNAHQDIKGTEKSSREEICRILFNISSPKCI